MKHNILFFLLFSCSLVAEPRWNVLMYTESEDGLSHACIKNIADLVHGYAKNNEATADIYIQLHCLRQEGNLGNEAFRFKVTKTGLAFCPSAYLSYDPFSDLLNAAQWALDPSADHHMIILGGHGYGVLNPQWGHNGKEFGWELEHDESMMLHQTHRALLLQREPQTYMTTEQLAYALNDINQNILQGKKIDIIGFDMCAMSMFEVSKELASVADIMIASQEYERDWGWPYGPIFETLGSAHNAPVEVARSIVDQYNCFCKEVIPQSDYTLSAVLLNTMSSIDSNLQDICASLEICREMYGTENFLLLLKKMTREVPRFSLVPMYTDLYDFYQHVVDMLSLFEDSLARTLLMQQLDAGKALLRDAIIANCAGTQCYFAQGLSIYLPLSHIDSSYTQKSAWVSLIEKMMEV